MLEEVLLHLRNWFEVEGEVHEGTFTIENGSISLPFLKNGQYFRVEGSIFNDGLHQNPATDLTDEVFVGTIFALAIPKEVQRIAEEISDWQEKYGDAAQKPFTSESFGGYSYSKGGTEEAAGGTTWQSAFRARLNAWRKL
jgi:hypothetical protein